MSNEIKTFFYDKNFTLVGRLFYPEILVPKSKKPGEAAKYSGLFSWPIQSPQNAATLQAMATLIGQAKQKFFPTIPDMHFVNPIKKYGVYQRTDGKPVADFLKDSYWLNMSSGEKFKPVVVDQNRQQIVDPVLIYSGMNVAVNISFYAINNTKHGLSTNLQAVMVMPGGEREGGAGNNVDINAAFGGFAADMGFAPQTNNTPSGGFI
jgi:hypothetical protein